MRDLYHALALPVAEDQQTCRYLADRIADQRQFQPALLAPAQSSALRVLYRFIHELPVDRFTLKSFTSAMRSDLASRGEHFEPNERKVGDILTSLGLTNRIRVNPGHYVLCLDRYDREQIHQKIIDYEVDGGSLTVYPNSCDICMKIKNQVEATSRSQTTDQNQKPKLYFC